MNVVDMLENLGEQLQSSATVKSVYGEPVVLADKVVIPVAQVRYGFGGGGGGRRGMGQEGGQTGGGGGGHVSAVPAGVSEITPSATRFIQAGDWRKTFALIVVSLALGFLAGKRS